MYSVVHHHVVAVINSEIGHDQKEIFILDAGCGNCLLMSLIYKKLREIRPSLVIHIYVFDVSDSDVQEADFFEKSILFLNQDAPECSWSDRLNLIDSKKSWPHKDNKFDFVISNQVLEHVFDHHHFFSEMRRVLKIGGKGVHVFPLRHYIYEGHLHLPFVHRISNWDYLFLYIKICSCIGLGKYKESKINNPDITLDNFAKRHADYMSHSTNYLTKQQILKICKTHNFRWSFRYSAGMYLNKVRSITGAGISYNYYREKRTIIDFILEKLLMRLSSITLFLEKKNIYR